MSRWTSFLGRSAYKDSHNNVFGIFLGFLQFSRDFRSLNTLLELIRIKKWNKIQNGLWAESSLWASHEVTQPSGWAIFTPSALRLQAGGTWDKLLVAQKFPNKKWTCGELNNEQFYSLVFFKFQNGIWIKI
jgi:hypothetical protein